MVQDVKNHLTQVYDYDDAVLKYVRYSKISLIASGWIG